MITHEMVPAVMAPEMRIAEILAGHVAEELRRGGGGVMCLRFACTRNDQPLGAEIGGAVLELLDRRRGKAIRFPGPGFLIVEAEMLSACSRSSGLSVSGSKP